MSSHEITLAFDRTGWCFHRIALQCINRLSDEFKFNVISKAEVSRRETDVLVCLWWNSVLQLKSRMRSRAIVTCVYDGLSWCIDEGSRQQFKMTLMATDVLAVCNREFATQIQALFDDVPPIMLVEDGVDTSLFKPMPLPKELVIGWTGNSSRMTPGGPEDQKGVEFLRKMVKEVGVNCMILDAANGGAWPHNEMPDFYKDISVYACPSFREGTPNPVLEAMACGRPVVSTPVGLVPQLVEPSVSGLVGPKTAAAWREMLGQIKVTPRQKLEKMGAAARSAVEAYDWAVKVEQFREIFHTAIRIANRPKKELLFNKLPSSIKAKPQVIRAEKVDRLPRLNRGRRRILLISDVENWAFHQNMVDLEQHLGHKYDFDHWFIVDFQKHAYVPSLLGYDCVFCVYHRWPIMGLLPWDRTVGSLRSLWFKPESMGPPDDQDVELVNRFRAFHVVTRQNYKELKDKCPKTVYLTNPVNMKRFAQQTTCRDFVVSWNGNARHCPMLGDVKGFEGIVKPTVKKTKVEFVYAEYNTKRLSPLEMPQFYQQASVALCTSLYEGASNSVMEAMAAGQALITTDVGNHREMHDAQLKRWGDSGIIIVKKRSVGAFVNAIVKLRATGMDRVHEMGEMNRREIEENWSWDVWAGGYDDFLQEGWA